jgi:hypothetical protein
VKGLVSGPEVCVLDDDGRRTGRLRCRRPIIAATPVDNGLAVADEQLRVTVVRPG